MLNAEAICLIGDLYHKAQGCVVKVPGDPDGLVHILDPEKGLQPYWCKPKPRGYRFFRLEDLISAVQLFHDGSRTLVLCGRGAIVASFQEDGDRRDVVRMDLPPSPEFQRLRDIDEEREQLTQKQFLSLLRISLAGCVDSALVSFFRDLRFQKDESGESKVDNSRESISRSVKMQLAAGGQDIPDECTVSVFVYSDLTEPELRRPIRCAIETDVQAGGFTLIPLAGELETAQRLTDAWIWERLCQAFVDEPEIEVLCGAP